MGVKGEVKEEVKEEVKGEVKEEVKEEVMRFAQDDRFAEGLIPPAILTSFLTSMSAAN